VFPAYASCGCFCDSVKCHRKADTISNLDNFKFFFNSFAKFKSVAALLMSDGLLARILNVIFLGGAGRRGHGGQLLWHVHAERLQLGNQRSSDLGVVARDNERDGQAGFARATSAPNAANDRKTRYSAGE
jgi:hypothetical protein